MTYYYCITDENGVECVDQMSEDTQWTEERMASHAEDFPHAIYFEYSRPRQGKCQHCGRNINLIEGEWVDVHATGDDSIWRETCDGNSESFVAPHEPLTERGR